MRTRAHTLATALFAVAVVSALTVACDDGESDDMASDTTTSIDATGDTTTTMDDVTTTMDDTDPGDAVADIEPPTFRDIRVILKSDTEVTLDLNNAGQDRVVPTAIGAEFTAFVRDDESDSEALAVVLVDDAGMPIDESRITSSTFVNGLWRIEAQVEVGERITVGATDEAGNSATWDNFLTLTPHDEAFVGSWEQRVYSPDQMVSGSVTATYAADGSVTQTDLDGVTRTGNWSLDGGDMVIEWRTSDAMGGDTDPETVEETVRGVYYIDEARSARTSWTRTSGEGTALQGEWALADGDRTGTLTLSGDGTFARTIDAETSSGTWELVVSENYAESSGDFLELVVTDEGGTTLPEPVVEFELYHTTSSTLVLAPWIRND